jgi:hypothetical protein
VTEASGHETPKVAGLKTRAAGLFLFLPLLARLGLDALVREAGYARSRIVPAAAALLSLLTLKLLDKEWRSHIDDFKFEGAPRLFNGLKILPKKSLATDYSYRAGPDRQWRLRAGWMKRLVPVLMPGANAIALRFHPIPYRGDEAVSKNHYIPGRVLARASVHSLFAQKHERGVLCSANDNLARAEQPAEFLRFVEFWHDLTGHDPEWLYFDSTLMTDAELLRFNLRDVHFVIIRHCGARLVQTILRLPAGDRTVAVIDIPKRRQKRVRYLEQPVRLRDYDGPVPFNLIDRRIEFATLLKPRSWGKIRDRRHGALCGSTPRLVDVIPNS